MKFSRRSLAVAMSTITVGISASASAQSEPQLHEEMVVTGQREARNEAIDLYRDSDSITNFIASDEMGQFVDQNVAESLQRLPGVSISRDQGEGRFVSVRGVSAGLSTVSINGMRIGTPEDGSRAVPLDVIPTGSVELIEVTKVPTPDMPGDAIGGAVNVTSGSAFDHDGERFRYRLEGSYNELSEEASPKVQLNYTDVVSALGGSDNVGISFGINYLDREFQSDNIEAAYYQNDDLGEEVKALQEVQLRKYYVNRERLGANLNLEYRPNDASRYYLNTVFSRFTDAETRQRSIFVFEDGTLADFDGRAGTFEEMPEDAFRRRIRFRTKEQDTLAMALGGEHVTDRMEVDYQLGYSETRERVPDETEGRFEYGLQALTGDFSIGGGLPTFQILNERSADASHLNHDNYVLDRVVLEPKFIDDDDLNASINVLFRDMFGHSALSVKTGLDFRAKSKDVDVNEIELRDVPDLGLVPYTTGAPDYPFHEMGAGISREAFLNDFYSRRNEFNIREQDEMEALELQQAEDFVADEDVSAAYLMGTYETDRWQLITGARVEHTRYDATGNLLDFDAQGNLSITPRSVDSSYTDVLPGIHWRYNLRDDMTLRAAWSTTVARPNFSDISPRFSINREDLEIEAGNSELDPYRSNNFDLMFDWYRDGGVISAGVFHKKIDDYIVDFTSTANAEFPGYEVTTPVNGTDASVTGIELNWEEQLGAFLVGGNLTFLDTELSLEQRDGEKFALPESAERSGNLYLGYEMGRFSSRLSVSHRDEYLSEVGDTSAYDLYVAPHTQVDLTAAYRVNPLMDLVFELTNINDEPLELYQGSEGYTYQLEEYGRTVSVGVRGRF
ncbi:TonB-dependent receptor [Marinimicrobium sp. ARAG 43.8]|uniref:TonB-dependent receptor n=1 Tax=Marinimicrobium sp. ARAG 43.8 TaxID=3418719 RepID=UPI003CE8798C